MKTQNNSDAILAVIASLASTDATYQNASVAFAAAIDAAQDAGIKSGDLVAKGKWYIEMQTAIAHVRLSPEDLALWSDKTKAPVGSPKLVVAKRINSFTARIRDRLAQLEGAAMAQVVDPAAAAAPDAPDAKGTKGTKASFLDLQADDLTRLYTRAGKDEGEHGEFQAQLIKTGDLLQLTWANNKFAAKK